MDLDTGLVRAFLTTADESHFGRAAARLFISQQALSKRIARLESRLGVTLFERTNRTVALTDAGRRFRAPAAALLEAADAAVSAAGATPGPVRIDVMEEHAAATGLVRRMIAEDPALAVRMCVRGDRAGVADAVRGGMADIAFGRACRRPWPAGLRRRCVLREPVTLLVGAGHPLWERDAIPAAELRGLPMRFAMHSAPEDWRTFVDDFSAEFGVRVEDGTATIGFDHFLDLAAGRADAATFYGAYMAEPPDPRLRVVPIVAPTPVFAWAAVWRRPVFDALVDRLGMAGPPGPVWLPPADRAWLAS